MKYLISLLVLVVLAGCLPQEPIANWSAVYCSQADMANCPLDSRVNFSGALYEGQPMNCPPTRIITLLLRGPIKLGNYWQAPVFKTDTFFLIKGTCVIEQINN